MYTDTIFDENYPPCDCRIIVGINHNGYVLSEPNNDLSYMSKETKIAYAINVRLKK